MTRGQHVEVATVERRILQVRGERVIIDADLADFYGVTTKRLNEQVKRNRDRFPSDFMFRLTAKEKAEVVARCDHLARLKFAKARPNAFTEHGAIMAASVLNSPRAVEMSLFIVRAFIKLRQVATEHHLLAERLGELERKLGEHDSQIHDIVQAVRALLSPSPVPARRRIGFQAGNEA